MIVKPSDKSKNKTGNEKHGSKWQSKKVEKNFEGKGRVCEVLIVLKMDHFLEDK